MKELAYMYDSFERARETIHVLNELQCELKLEVEYMEVPRNSESKARDKRTRNYPHEFFLRMHEETYAPTSLFDPGGRHGEGRKETGKYHLVVVRLSDESISERVERIMWSSAGVRSDKPANWHYSHATKALVMASDSVQFMEILSGLNAGSDTSIHGGKYGQ